MMLDISMMIPGLPIDGETLEKRSMGGSETAAIYMARELARLGACVQVFCNTDKPGRYDDVMYRPADAWNLQMFTPTDVNIVQRVPQAFGSRMASKLNV